MFAAHRMTGCVRTAQVNTTCKNAAKLLPNQAWRLACCLLFLGTHLALPANAAILATHQDNLDPVSEGWTLAFASAGATGTAANDGGTLAWRINAPASRFFEYQKNSAPVLAGTTNTLGWKFTAEARVATSSNNLTNVHFRVDDGLNRWSLDLVNDGANDGIRYWAAGSTSQPLYAMETGDVHHRYQMILNTMNNIYGDSDDSLSVYVDSNPIPVGTLTRGMMVTAGVGEQGLWFGDNTSAGTSTDTYWSFLQFESIDPAPAPVPEPASWLSLAGMLLVCRKKRQTRG